MRSFIKSSLTLSLGQIGAQLLFIAFTPALTRIYGPEAFSYALTFYALSVILGIVSSGRLDLAVVVAQSNSKAIDVYATGLVCTFLVCGTLSVAIVALRLLNVSLTAIHPILEYAHLFPIMGAVYSIQLLSLALSNRHRRYGQMSIAIVSGAVVMVGFALVSNGGDGLLFGRILGVAAVSVLLLLALRGELNFFASRLSRMLLWRTLRENKRFPTLNVPYSSIEAFAAESFAIIAIYFLAAELAGYFVLVRLVLVMPMSIASTAVGHVFFRDAVEQLGTPELERRAVILWRAICCVMAPYFGVVLFFGPLLFTLVFGAEWSVAGQLSAIYFATALIISLTGFPARIYEVAGRQDVALKLAAAYVALKMTVLGFAFASGQPDAALIGINATIDGLYYVTYLYCLAKIAGFNIRKIAFVVTNTTLTLALPSAGLSYLTYKFLGDSIVAAGTAITIATAIAVAGLVNLRSGVRHVGTSKAASSDL